MTETVIEENTTEETPEEEEDEEEDTCSLAEIIEEAKKELEKKEKLEGTISFVDKIGFMLDYGEYDPDFVNLRRKHPKLGKKIGEILARLNKTEVSISRIKSALSNELKESAKKVLLKNLEENWNKILEDM